jgi:hypothetical protein
MKTSFRKLTPDMAQSATRRAALKKFGIAFACMALLAGAVCVTGFGQKYYRLGGGWVGGGSAYTWSVMFAPSDPAGQTAAARTILKYFNNQFSGLLASFGAENVSDATGEIKMVSPDTARWTLVSYMQVAPKQPGDVLENKAIIVAHGTWQFTSDKTALLNYVLEVYFPSADADGDGFPDAGAQPALSVPLVETAKRVPIL